MKSKALFTLAAIVALLASCQKQEPIQLFNGQDLTGWTYITDPNDSLPGDETFTASDGVIHISGKPFGYMRTTTMYNDYTLHLEYRWAGEEKADGGIFNRLQGEDHVWPAQAIQFQMRPDDYGFLFSGYAVEGIEGENFFKKSNMNTEDPEKPLGEWNDVDITCTGKHIVVKVNGQLVNDAICDATIGYIGMQSEGGPLDIRNIFIVEKK